MAELCRREELDRIQLDFENLHLSDRDAFDYRALADTLDFISYMTYAQHAGGSTPGPVAGFPWMVASLGYLLALGVNIGYARLMGIIRDAGATPVWDDKQKAWYAMWESHGVFEPA